MFQNWLSSFHVCSPSRASHLTGRYSIRSGIGIPNCKYAPDAPGYTGCNTVFTAEAIGGLPLNETVTAEALKGAGYATGMVGKCERILFSISPSAAAPLSGKGFDCLAIAHR